jgi:hypothetical protein
MSVAMAPKLPTRLKADGLGRPQALAVELARAGRSVVIAAGTSDPPRGYEIPVAEAAAGTHVGEAARPGTSILLFPSRDLAGAALRSLDAWDVPGLRTGAYDGKAGRLERARMRRTATVVFTNPAMLHRGLLPHHDLWASFLSRLRYIVIDDLTAFGDVGGNHVAHVVRRLHRLAHHYGADPTFVCCSPGVGQPTRLAEILCGVGFDAVRDGPPSDPPGGAPPCAAAALEFPDIADAPVLCAQLRCAAYELPLTHADARYWPDTLDDGVRLLVLDNQVVIRQRRSWLGVEAVYCGGGWPAGDMPLT